MGNLIDGEAKIIYRNNKPYGIRDDIGFLFFFSKITKYTGQEEIENLVEIIYFVLERYAEDKK